MDDLIERAYHGGASDLELQRLTAWRAESPAHERTYRETIRLLQAADTLKPELAASAPPTAFELLSRRAARRVLAPPRQRLPMLLAAAAVVLLAINLARPAMAPRPAVVASAAEIVTGVGEIATVQLGDGSVVRLAPVSRLRINDSGDARTVALEGRAFFSIAEDAVHPFRVRTRGAMATVLGTRFEIATDADELRLVVVEGRVALDAPENRVEVAAGEEAAVTNRRATNPTALASAAEELLWTGKFLAFQNTPLVEAVREISRTYQVQVVVTDSALARRSITAVFTGQSLDAVLDVVCAVVNAQCSIRGNDITISPD